MDVTQFITPLVLESEHWVYPMLQWKFPRDIRWDYVKKVESMVLALVGKELGWTDIKLTEGFCDTHDADVMTKLGPIKVEIKTTDKESIFIEGGRTKNGVAERSGLSATESDVYIILSRNMVIKGSDLHYVGKVRVAFTSDLIDEYMDRSVNFEYSFPAGPYGPGSTGIHLNQFDLPHIWIGDVYCVVEYDTTRYKLSKWKHQYKQVGKARDQFYQQLQKKVERFNTATQD